MQTYSGTMKSQKSSFMVKDILGLRSEDDFSQLEHERLKRKCDEDMNTENREENTSEVETSNGI